MPSSGKKYEEFAYVLGIKRRIRSRCVRAKTGDIVYAVGQKFLNLLEILIDDDVSFDTGSKLSIGSEVRSDIQSVLGRISYKNTPPDVLESLPTVLKTLILDTEERFVTYVNTAGYMSARISALGVLPGVGKSMTKLIMEERKIKKFESFADIKERVGIDDIVSSFAKKIESEIAERTRICMFVKR